jgi:hypothetical protein
LKTPACFKTAKSRRHLGPPANRCASIHASVALLALTGINLIGRLQSKRAQLTFTALEVIAVLTVIVAGGNFGLRLSPPRSDASSPLPRSALPADADRVLSHLSVDALLKRRLCRRRGARRHRRAAGRYGPWADSVQAATGGVLAIVVTQAPIAHVRARSSL